MPNPSPLSPSNALIIGGGVIGLASAWRLAQQGWQVTLCERLNAGSGASNAAAGMLAPQIEAEPGEEPLLPLLLAAQNAWPTFAADLEAASGRSVDYRRDGTLMAARDKDQLAALKRQFAYLSERLNLDVTWLERDALLKREPQLHQSVLGGSISPQDHQVDNRLLVKALLPACRNAGVTVREQCLITELLIENGVCTGARALEDTFQADAVLICGGAWSKLLRHFPASLRPLMRPVKGQMLALKQDKAAPLLRHVVWGEHIYLAPKSDGRLLVGATVEDIGFDEKVTAGGLYQLIERAYQLLPGILELPVVETWAGLRPGSLDDAPILGKTGIDGLFIASGHYRNGILLTPLTAEAVPGLLSGAAASPLWARYGLDRFKELMAA
ncbi:MAG: glycine oxidase ThiO [Thalassospira sp.]|nr:glycine oxidase ThiO [Thalassospira sp.]